MRAITATVLTFFLAFYASPLLAQEDRAIYLVTDVTVDVTADSATAARDQALVQAQRDAFNQLLSRLGSEDRTPPTTDDAIAVLVQAFEVQKEFVRGVRYKGTFSIQFRPEKVRELMGLWGVSITESRSLPMLILPIFREQARDVLWEDATPWRDAWQARVKNAGLVPLIIPSGDLDDIAKISTREALDGKAQAIVDLVKKYQAGGLCVAVLVSEPPKETGGRQAEVHVMRYTTDGAPVGEWEKWLLSVQEGTMVALIDRGIQQVVSRLEQGWREERNQPEGPPVFLPVNVAVPTLAAWERIRQKLSQLPMIVRAHMVTMTRGLVHIELEFRGNIPLLQEALKEQDLLLQAQEQGGWILIQEE